MWACAWVCVVFVGLCGVNNSWTRPKSMWQMCPREEEDSDWRWHSLRHGNIGLWQLHWSPQAIPSEIQRGKLDYLSPPPHPHTQHTYIYIYRSTLNSALYSSVCAWTFTANITHTISGVNVIFNTCPLKNGTKKWLIVWTAGRKKLSLLDFVTIRYVQTLQRPFGWKYPDFTHSSLLWLRHNTLPN